ncbi:hypothetical protein [Dactylosporangium sp. CS-033363]|uniref:hypothetical protein n=1 Tax=Dactylosporangium sp. CS-033363 TaxID=3239935 RepID=UPI003D934A3C
MSDQPDPFLDNKTSMRPGALQPIDKAGHEWVNMDVVQVVRVVDIDRSWRVQVVLPDRSAVVLASPVAVSSPQGREAVTQVLEDWLDAREGRLIVASEEQTAGTELLAAAPA